MIEQLESGERSNPAIGLFLMIFVLGSGIFALIHGFILTSVIWFRVLKRSLRDMY
jgi:hypothetical protein